MNDINYILQAPYILTMNSEMDLIHNGAIAIKDNKIIEVGVADEILKKYRAKQVIHKANHVMMPGLINTHAHAGMTYFRGFADDMLLKEWLEDYVWPLEKRMLSPLFVYNSTKLACLEMLKGGITTFLDMYYFEDSVIEAVKSMSQRALVGPTFLDIAPDGIKSHQETLTNAEQFFLKWQHDDLIMPIFAPHSLYAYGHDNLKDIIELAHKFSVPLHIHLSEPEWEVQQICKTTGMRPAEYLESIGFFEGISSAAHCIWLDEHEIEILAKHNVLVAHCIESNLKMAAGFAPVVPMLNAGVNVAFGTDSAVSNNDLNIFSEMATAAKVHKTLAKDSRVLDAKTVLTMATRKAAEGLGLADKLGILAKDCLADIICIDMRKPHLAPLYDVYSHLVYAATASDVDMVMVNGKLLMNERKVLVCAEDDIINTAIEWQEKIINN